MTRRQSGSLVDALAVVAVSVVAAKVLDHMLTPDEVRRQQRRNRGRAQKYRREADLVLHRKLKWLSKHSWDPKVRMFAAVGAREFHRRWIATGRSGEIPPRRFRKALYGNWCGAGHGGGPTVDALDALCRDHDMAYREADRMEKGLA